MKTTWLPIALIWLILTGFACAPRATERLLPEDIREGVRFTIGQTFQVEPGQVRIVDCKKATWPDGCLGISMRGTCSGQEVKGYRFFVDINGSRYEYRAPESDPLALTLAAAPEVALPTPLLEWEGRQENPLGERCMSLRLYEGGQAAFGYCEGPHAIVPLQEGRQWELAALRERFASFTFDQWERLRFEGAGPERASDAWQKAISSWAGILRLETEAGRSGASIGTAFVMQRPTAGKHGYCDYLTIEMYGRAAASRSQCGGGDAVNLGDGWLTTPEMEQFDRWFYQYGVSEYERNGVMLRFFGKGRTAWPEAELARLHTWAEAAFVRLAAK